jgi:hypothetical protein
VALRFVAIALLAIVAHAIDSYTAVSQPVSGNCELDNDVAFENSYFALSTTSTGLAL